MTTHYLNTDLEIDSRDDLTPIVDEFGDEVVCLHNGPWGSHNRAAFEVAGLSQDASSCIRRFCALVEGLTPEARTLWDGCTRRTFDIGFQAGDDRENCQQLIDQDALAQIAAVRAHLVVTVYPAK
jgi:hypothetical protein